MNKMQRILTMGLSAVMSLALIGCGKSGEKTQEVDLKNTTYEAKEFPAEGVKGDVKSIQLLDGRLYIYTSEYTDLTKYPADWVDGEPPEDADESVWDSIDYKYAYSNRLYSMNQDGSDVKEMMETETTDEGMEIRNVSVLGSGEVLLLNALYNEATESSEFALAVYDGNGKKKDEISLTDLLEPDEYITRMLTDKEERIYLECDKRVLVIDKEGKELFSVKSNDYISEMFRDKDGNVLTNSYVEEGNAIKMIDAAQKGFGKSVALESRVNALYTGSGSYDFYLDDGSNLMGYNMDGSHKSVLNWIGSNILSQNVSYLTALEDGNFVAWAYDDDASHGSLMLYQKVDPSKVGDTKAIVFGGLYLNEDIKKQAIKYNKSQNKYRIVLRDYSGEDDPEGRMNADILAGDVPDLLDLSMAPVDKYVSKGMLLDLYPLIDSDPELKREDFIDNVLKSLEMDGKLYYISPSFSVSLLVGDKKDIGDKKALTMDDLVELENQYKGGKVFSLYDSRTRVLEMLCQNCFDSFIDWSTGKCSFDSDEFVKILEYAGTYPDEEDINYDDEVDQIESVRNKKMILMETYNMSFEDLELYDQIFKQNVGFTGLPADGKGIGTNINSMVGIYAKSPNQEGAWDFYRTLLTREYVNSSDHYMEGFPLRKDAYDDMEKRVTTTKAYTDDFGNKIEPLSGSWGFQSITVDIKPLTEEQAGMMRDIIASIDHKVVYNTDVMNIISEEAGAYFSGAKSAKETASIIQNRVSTYVNENR